MVPTIGILLILLSTASYFWARSRASKWESIGTRLPSRAHHYGWFGILRAILPAWILFAVSLLLYTTRIHLISGPLFLVLLLVCLLGGIIMAAQQLRPNTNARKIVERNIHYLLIASAMVSILTTIGIVLAIFFEAMHFFSRISILEFFTGTTWSPDSAFTSGAGRGDEMVAEPQFGSLPIFAGTFMITFIALSVALPIGLFAAIYMAEYASYRGRKFLKPLLEVLAGIPTVVYGFFAALTVSPMVVEIAAKFGIQADYTNALSAGMVMGIMIIPFISSLSDDVITSVPVTLREGGLALGTTKSETIKQIILPAAMPGIVSAFLLAVSRAVGETMIVVMAAGLRPNLTMNPFEGMTTVTVRIVDSLTGDLAFDSLETLSAFGLGFVLLMFTLILNIISSIVIRRFKKSYE